MLRKMFGMMAAVVAMAGVALADDNAPQKKTDDEAHGHKHKQERLEAVLANCLLLKNEEEIVLSRIALEHSSNPQVKEFAQQAISDHEKCVAELRKFATHKFELKARHADHQAAKAERRETRAAADKAAAAKPDAAKENASKDNPETTSKDEASAKPAEETKTTTAAVEGVRVQVTTKEGEHKAGEAKDHEHHHAHAHWMERKMFEIQHKAAQECLAMAEECLSKKQGAEFDKAFIGMQIGMHMGMVAHLRAAKDEVTGDFQKLVTEGLKTAEEHKAHAEQIIEELNRGAPATAQKKDEATNKK